MSRAEDIFQKLVYFGEDAIDEFILNLQTEELFLDFKQAVSTGKNFTTLHKDDRRNLAKAISGFGNSEGGVVVWGVVCSRDTEVGDVAKAKVKVKNVHRFLSWLENAISGCTIPSHNKVRNHIVSVDENGDGFVATYIPKSDITPLMTTSNSTIYIRSGSNNVPAPYAVIAGMFGKSPQPNIELLLEDKNLEILENIDEDMLYPKTIDNPPEKYVKISFSVIADNQSNAIAKELYFSCTTEQTGSDYNKVRFLGYNQMDSLLGIAGHFNLITKPEMRLPPRGKLKFTTMQIILSPFAETDFCLNGVIGAQNATPKDFRIMLTKNQLRSFVAKALRNEDEKEALLLEFLTTFLKSA
ncbi:MAG: putative DNA binding domain-containing protein [Alphaproteobacteria bacterium]|nr:putative DNA binding domain-containing protein [Alphaproteobacteria bacterium]MBQ7659777.1 putative DNA binding domain-containing protein [Alphaproteobacteria bacterium]